MDTSTLIFLKTLVTSSHHLLLHLFPGGRSCPCGNQGCLERYASTKAFVSGVRERTRQLDLGIDQIQELCHQQDPIIVEEFNTVISYLSIGINNLITSFAPDEIIINNTFFNQIPSLVDLLKSKLNSRFSSETKLSVSKLKDKATLYGGIAVVTSDYLIIENLKFNIILDE